MVNGEALFHMQKKKLVILAAVTGGSQQDRDGAKVPCTPAEIADEALRCYKAGASVVHIHAHDEKGRKQPTGDLNVFKDIINRIRDKCDILIQTTNGIGSRRDPVTGKIIRPTEEERLGVLTIEPRQDLYCSAGGSWGFYHPGVPGKNEFSFANSTEFLRKYIPGVMATGGALEFEITEASALTKLRRLADEGVFNAQKSRLWFDYCLGFGMLRFYAGQLFKPTHGDVDILRIEFDTSGKSINLVGRHDCAPGAGEGVREPSRRGSRHRVWRRPASPPA